MQESSAQNLRAEHTTYRVPVVLIVVVDIPVVVVAVVVQVVLIVRIVRSS